MTNTWVRGTHSRSSVHGFFGLGEEQTHRTEFVFDGDHPEVFSAEDNGATPVELLLVSLASCLTAGVAAVAQNRGIQLRSVQRHPAGRHGHPRHPRRGPRRAQRVQRDQGELFDRR